MLAFIWLTPTIRDSPLQSERGIQPRQCRYRNVSGLSGSRQVDFEVRVGAFRLESYATTRLDDRSRVGVHRSKRGRRCVFFGVLSRVETSSDRGACWFAWLLPLCYYTSASPFRRRSHNSGS